MGNPDDSAPTQLSNAAFVDTLAHRRLSNVENDLLGTIRSIDGEGYYVATGTFSFTTIAAPNNENDIFVPVPWTNDHISFIATGWPQGYWNLNNPPYESHFLNKGSRVWTVTQGICHVYSPTPQGVIVYWTSIGR